MERKGRDNIAPMAVHDNAGLSTHFGRQVKKERLAHGWSLRELSARSGIDYSHLSRIESGKRPPTEAMADVLDAAFPGRNGWFREYVRREAPCCIPDSVARNSEVYSWSQWLT
jgi:transcriptional regulator with XRE-family HTH domain